MERMVGSGRRSAHDGRVAGLCQGHRAARRREEPHAVDAWLGRTVAVAVRTARTTEPRGNAHHESPNDIERRRSWRRDATQHERRGRPWRVERELYLPRPCPRSLADPQREPIAPADERDRVKQERPRPGRRGGRTDAEAEDTNHSAHRDRAANPLLGVPT